MMGKGHDDDQAGIIPRLCKDLFNRINLDNDPDSQYSVEVGNKLNYENIKFSVRAIGAFKPSLDCVSTY